MPRTRTTTRKDGSRTFTIEVSATAIRAEQGRRANNKARKANGEAKASSRGRWVARLTRPEMDAILAGERVVKEFRSGNRAIFTLK